MTDNFEQIRSLLKFENEGDCYYVQLLRRQSDDPLIDGKKDPKYHGNMHSRSIKDYFIRSLEHFDDVKEDIIKLCEMFNVRAYIRLNKRTYKRIALVMLRHIAEQAASGETYSSPFHMIASAAGTANCAGDDKTWIVDEDAEYLRYEDKIKAIIEQCEPTDRQKVVAVIPTKSGRHLITRPFNLQTFKTLWEKDLDLQTLEVLDIHKDNPTILYVPGPDKCRTYEEVVNREG